MAEKNAGDKGEKPPLAKEPERGSLPRKEMITFQISVGADIRLNKRGKQMPMKEILLLFHLLFVHSIFQWK